MTLEVTIFPTADDNYIFLGVSPTDLMFLGSWLWKRFLTWIFRWAFLYIGLQLDLQKLRLRNACSINQLFRVPVINGYSKAWHFPSEAHIVLAKHSHIVCKTERDELTYPLDVLHHLLDVWPDHLCLFPRSKWQLDHYMRSSRIDKQVHCRLSDETFTELSTFSLMLQERYSLLALDRRQVLPKGKQALLSLNAGNWGLGFFLRETLYSIFIGKIPGCALVL